LFCYVLEEYFSNVSSWITDLSVFSTAVRVVSGLIVLFMDTSCRWIRLYISFTELRYPSIYFTSPNSPDLPIPGIIVLPKYIRKANDLMIELDKLWDGFETRRLMFYYVANSKINSSFPEGNNLFFRFFLQALNAVFGYVCNFFKHTFTGMFFIDLNQIKYIDIQHFN
jgi:hypothetical protein